MTTMIYQIIVSCSQVGILYKRSPVLSDVNRSEWRLLKKLALLAVVELRPHWPKRRRR